jgi:hypothetical protein
VLPRVSSVISVPTFPHPNGLRLGVQVSSQSVGQVRNGLAPGGEDSLKSVGQVPNGLAIGEKLESIARVPSGLELRAEESALDWGRT